MRHLNVCRLRPFVVERFHAGRIFAAARSSAWPRWRRQAYALAWPLVPAVRLVRIGRDLRRIGRLTTLAPRLALPLLLGPVVRAAGEALGYTSGRGGSTAAIAEIELRRADYAAPPLLPLPES